MIERLLAPTPPAQLTELITEPSEVTKIINLIKIKYLFLISFLFL
jgi:hypothetical protein